MPTTANTLLNRFIVKAKFRHMQVLIKLTELGSMRRAAEAVNMTQPAVSQLVSELEKLLDTKLFFRHARGVEPTPATRDLLPVAARILSALEEGSEAIASRLIENDGIVRVSASPAAIGGILHGRLDGFAQTYPGIQVQLTEVTGPDPLAALENAMADVACTRMPAVIPEGWIFEQCVEDELIAVCGKSHPLAAKADVSMEDLGAAKWLQNRVGSVARSRFEELALANDWPNTARCQVILHIPILTREMLLTGKYLAILPRSVANPWLGSGEIKPLETSVTCPLAPLGVLWRKDNVGQAVERLVGHLTR